jgi:hypothetical protein
MPKVNVNYTQIYHEVHGEGFPLVMITARTKPARKTVGSNVGSNLGGAPNLIFDKTDEFHYLPEKLCRFWTLISIA